jgi:hypothetical protein
MRIPNNGIIKLKRHRIGKPGSRVRTSLLGRAGLAFLIAVVTLLSSISLARAGVGKIVEVQGSA